MNILAIDLGKFNSMCCFFETESQNVRVLERCDDSTLPDETAAVAQSRLGGDGSLWSQRLDQRPVPGAGAANARLQHQRRSLAVEERRNARPTKTTP